jgi:type 1 fimbria pilin
MIYTGCAMLDRHDPRRFFTLARFGIQPGRRLHMRRLALAIAGSLMLVLLSVSFAVARDRTFNGDIMDSACAKMGSHDGMMKAHADIKDAKACTLGCVKGGAKFVLYDAASKTVYELDDQQKPVRFAGEKVKVTGTIDRATNTIHVTDIQGAS